MKNNIKNIFLFILFPLWGLGGFAQVFPVQVTPVFNTPYTSKISEYATSFDTKFQLIVNPTDISINNRQVRFKISIIGNNINAQSADFITGQNPIYINGGELITFTNVELAALFRLENLQGISAVQYANPLPEGSYSFCFEMYDFFTNQRISQKSCANIYLMLNDPPILNLPTKQEQIAVSDFPNILFTWTPRQINATNVSYKFELKEILDPNIDPQYGFEISPMRYEEELFSTALVYDIGKPNLIPNKRYAWRVRAISTSGLSENAIFKNNGYSEVFWFTYASNCPSPSFVLSEVTSPKSVKLTWQGAFENTKYHVQYKKRNIASAQWFSVYTLNTQATISDLEPETAYEFRVGASCEPAGVAMSYNYSGINNFDTPVVGSTNAAYNCGINPAVAIANQMPLPNLIPSETFTAGDFPVKVLEVSGSNGMFTGIGYITVPYLADTKIAVVFNNVTINTAYQLINGIVETTYDPNWENVIDIDPNDPDIIEVNSVETADTTPITTVTNTSVTEPTNNNTGIVTVTPTTGNNNGNSSNTNSNSNPNSNTTTSNPNTTGTTGSANNSTNTITEAENKFQPVSLLAYDANNVKRVAQANQTLYYVTQQPVSLLSTDLFFYKRKTGLTLKINPNLSKSKIDKEKIKWFTNGTEINRFKGELKIKIDSLKNKDYNIKSIAGNTEAKTNEVKIKVVAENFQSDNIEADITKIKAVEDLLKKLKNYIGIPIYVSKEDYKEDTGFSILFSPSYKNERKNVESKEDRLYYKEIKNVVQLEGGIKGGIKKIIPGLGIPEFKKTIFGKEIKIACGIYWYIEANASATVGITKTSQEWIESTSKNNTKIIYGEPSEFVLGATIGLDPRAEIEAPGLTFLVTGKSSANVDLIKYDFKTGEKSFPMLEEGILLKAEPKVNFEFGFISYSHIFPKMEYKLKFW